MRILKVSFLAVAMVGFGFFANGQEKKSKFTTVEFRVDGICNMCKSRIEGAANMAKGVKVSEWSKEKQMITVTYKTKKTSPEEIAKEIAEVGHDSQYVTATDKQYAKVHKCCLYRTSEVH